MEPGHIQPGSVVITPTQMYDEMRAISKSVDHLAAIIDPALAEVRQDVADNRAEIKAHDVRLRGIEGRLWFAAGFASVLGAGGGYLASFLTGG